MAVSSLRLKKINAFLLKTIVTLTGSSLNESSAELRVAIFNQFVIIGAYFLFFTAFF
jgi:hypothetical protein